MICSTEEQEQAEIKDTTVNRADMEIMVYLSTLDTRKLFGSQKILKKNYRFSCENDFFFNPSLYFINNYLGIMQIS